MHDVTLTGLDGTNPLAFLAALGALAAVGEQAMEANLRWKYEGTWQPVLGSAHQDIDAVVEHLDTDRASCSHDPVLALEYDGKRDLKPPRGVFKQFLVQLLTKAGASNRRSLDWAGALATDIAVDNNGNTKPTALHFTAGQQQFLQMALELADHVTTDDLEEAIKGPWRYEQTLPVMGWDATSSRDYALRASDPSTDKKRGVPGADWLAVRGLAFLPAVPRGNRIATTGCVGGWKDGRFRWPLWTVPLSSVVIRSVLGQDVEAMPKLERMARGIGAVLSSGIKRSDQGGYGSFDPSSTV